MQRRVLVWCVFGFLMCGSATVRAAQSAQQFAPATMVREMRLGPAAGNGTRPFAAAMDTRRNRLWVLNRVPQCLSVVDLKQRRVVDVVPLAPPMTGWDNSEPFFAMTYDPQADRILIAKGNSALPGVVIAVAASTHKIAALRTFPDQVFLHFAFNPKRGDIYASCLGRDFGARSRLMVLDSRSLATKRILTLGQPIQAMAASEATGLLYTVEPISPDVLRNGIAGPYSETRIVARDPVNGEAVSTSPDTFPYPHSLLMDDVRRRMILVHGSVREGETYTSFVPTTVSVLAQSSLKRQRRLRYSSLSGTDRQPLALGNPILDASRNRLITDLYSNGNLVVLSLAGTPRAVLHPVEGSLYSQYRLGTVLPQTGQPVLLIDNAVRLLDSQTLKSGASVTLGTTVEALFLDRETHRLLAYVDSEVHAFQMLGEGKPRRLFKSYLLPRAHPLAVDFARKRIYYVDNDGWGSGVVLHSLNFDGKPIARDSRAEGEVAGLILTGSPDRFLRLLFPNNPESSHAQPRRALERVTGNRAIRSVSVAMPASLMPPQQLLYAPQADRAYLLSGLTLTSYSAADLSALGSISLNALIEKSDMPSGQLPGKLAVDEAGQYGYYADPGRKQIVQFRLAEGHITERRSLPFTPALPLVDSAQNRLYLVDADGGRVVALSLSPQ